MMLIVFGLLVIGFLWIYADPRPLGRRFSDGILNAYLLLLVIVLPQVISFFYFPLPETSFDNFIAISGFILFFLGVFIDIWARITMGKYWGPPGQHDSKRQSKLITTGPFVYSRNPIYVGTFFLLLGFSLTLRSIFFFLPILHLIYFTKQIEVEEKLLEEKFEKEYKEYRRKVKRFI